MIETKSLPTQTPAKPKTSSANFRSIGLLLSSVVLGAVGQLLLKVAVNQMGRLELSVDMLLRLATNPVLLLALAIYGVSAGLWLLALMKADLSFAYPFLSLTYVIVLLGGAFLFSENVSALRLIGFSVILCGLFVIAQDEKSTGSTQSTGSTPE